MSFQESKNPERTRRLVFVLTGRALAASPVLSSFPGDSLLFPP